MERKDMDTSEDKDEKNDEKKKTSRKRGREHVIDISANSNGDSKELVVTRRSKVDESGEALVPRLKKYKFEILQATKKIGSSSRLFIDFAEMTSSILVEIASFLEIRNRIHFARTQKGGNYLLLKEPVSRLVKSVLQNGMDRMDSSLGNAQYQLAIPICDFIWNDRLKYAPGMTPYAFKPVSEISLRRHTTRRLQTYFNQILDSGASSRYDESSEIREIGPPSKSRLRKIGSHVINHVSQLKQAAYNHCDVSEVCLDSEVLFQELSTCKELTPFTQETRRIMALVKKTLQDFIKAVNEHATGTAEWTEKERIRIAQERKVYDEWVIVTVRQYEGKSPFPPPPQPNENIRDFPGNAIFFAENVKHFSTIKELSDMLEDAIYKITPSKASLGVGGGGSGGGSAQSGNDTNTDWDIEAPGPLKSPVDGSMCWPLAFAFGCWGTIGNNLQVLTLTMASESSARQLYASFNRVVYGFYPSDPVVVSNKNTMLEIMHETCDAFYELLRVTELPNLHTFNFQSTRIWVPAYVVALTSFIMQCPKLSSLMLDYHEVAMPCIPVHIEPYTDVPDTYGARQVEQAEIKTNQNYIKSLENTIINHPTRWKRLCFPRPVRGQGEVLSNVSRFNQERDFIDAFIQKNCANLEELSYKWLPLIPQEESLVFEDKSKTRISGVKSDYLMSNLTSLHTLIIDKWEVSNALQHWMPALKNLHLGQVNILSDILGTSLSPLMPLNSLTINSLTSVLPAELKTHQTNSVITRLVSITNQLPHLQKLSIRFDSEHLLAPGDDEKQQHFVNYQENIRWAKIICKTSPKLTHFMMCSRGGVTYVDNNNAKDSMDDMLYLSSLGLNIGATLQTLVLPYGFQLEPNFFKTGGPDKTLFPNLQVLDLGSYGHEKTSWNDDHQIQSPAAVFEFINTCTNPSDGRRIEIRIATLPHSPWVTKPILYAENYDEFVHAVNLEIFEILCILMLSAKLRYTVDKSHEESKSSKPALRPLYPNINVAIKQTNASTFFDPVDLLDFEQYRARIGDVRTNQEKIPVPTRDEMMQELSRQDFNDAESTTRFSEQIKAVADIALILYNKRAKRREELLS